MSITESFFRSVPVFKLKACFWKTYLSSSKIADRHFTLDNTEIRNSCVFEMQSENL